MELNIKPVPNSTGGAENKNEILSREELQSKLLSLGFGHLKLPGKKQSDAMAGIKYEWKPGHVVRQKAFFFTQWIGRRFHEILQQQPEIFAVHSYYLREGESFETLCAIHKSSPNAIIVLHDHPITSYCTPTSVCKELEHGKW